MKSTDRSARTGCPGFPLSHAQLLAYFSLFTFLFSLELAAQPPQAAFAIRNLSNPRDRREAGAAALDTPTLSGSVMKAVTLVTALESGVIAAGTTSICRRVVTVDGVRFTCSHPDLQRPLSPAEALAHSCNSFFVALAPRLARDAVNRTRLAAGLPPLGPQVPLAPADVGQGDLPDQPPRLAVPLGQERVEQPVGVVRPAVAKGLLRLPQRQPRGQRHRRAHGRSGNR